MLPTFCPLTIWAISLEFCRKTYILEADDFLGACYRKAMTPKKLWTLLFLQICKGGGGICKTRDFITLRGSRTGVPAEQVPLRNQSPQTIAGNMDFAESCLCRIHPVCTLLNKVFQFKKRRRIEQNGLSWHICRLRCLESRDSNHGRVRPRLGTEICNFGALSPRIV